MTLATLVALALKISLVLTVFAVALHARPGDAWYLLRHRALLGRSLLAMHVVMPSIALVFTSAIPVHPAVRLALVALMISSIPAVLPTKTLRAGGDAAFTMSLFALASMLSMLIVPASVAVLGAIRGLSIEVPPRAVARVVGIGILLPLVCGLGVVRIAPQIAARAAGPLPKVANVVLLLAVIPLLVTTWPAMRQLIGNGTLVVIAAVELTALAVGWAFGGPRREDRLVLSLATAARHPGVAVAVAAATFPAEKLAPAAVLLALLVGAVVTGPWMRRLAPRTSGGAGRRRDYSSV